MENSILQRNLIRFLRIFKVLKFIYVKSNSTSKEIKKYFGLKKTTCSRYLKIWEINNLITLRESEDKRILNISKTSLIEPFLCKIYITIIDNLFQDIVFSLKIKTNNKINLLLNFSKYLSNYIYNNLKKKLSNKRKVELNSLIFIKIKDYFEDYNLSVQKTKKEIIDELLLHPYK